MKLDILQKWLICKNTKMLNFKFQILIFGNSKLSNVVASQNLFMIVTITSQIIPSLPENGLHPKVFCICDFQKLPIVGHLEFYYGNYFPVE